MDAVGEDLSRSFTPLHIVFKDPNINLPNGALLIMGHRKCQFIITPSSGLFTGIVGKTLHGRWGNADGTADSVSQEGGLRVDLGDIPEDPWAKSDSNRVRIIKNIKRREYG